MPTIEYAKPAMWSCDCEFYAFDPLGQKTEEELSGILRRATKARAIDKAGLAGNVIKFTTLTTDKKGDRFHYPVYNPSGEGGGFCVHCAACVPCVVGDWFSQLLGKESGR